MAKHIVTTNRPMRCRKHLDRRVDDGYRQYGYEIYKAVDPDIEESQSRHNDSGADESEDHIAAR